MSQKAAPGNPGAAAGSGGSFFVADGLFGGHDHFTVIAGEYFVHQIRIGLFGQQADHGNVEAIGETEESDMKFLEVTSGKCEVFTAPDVNAVDKHYNGGKLTEGVCYPVQAEVGSSGGYSWVRIFVAGMQRYAVVLADRCQLVTLSPGDAFAACVAQGGDAAGQRAQRDGRQAGAYAQRTEASGTAPGV